MLLAGCDSDDTKLERLDQERAVAYMLAWHAHKVADSVAAAPSGTAVIQAYADTARLADREKAIADRAYAQFIAGQ